MKEDYISIFDEFSRRMSINTKEVLTAEEAAMYLGLSMSHLYRLTSLNQIPYSKPNGKLMYFRRTDIETWAMSNPIASEQQLDDIAMAYTGSAKSRCRK